MAGRKKTGDLGNTISIRLDRVIDEQVRKIAQQSPAIENDVSSVIRVLVTAFFMRSKVPLDEFGEIALAVNAWRKQYAAGFLDAKGTIETRANGPKRKRRRKGTEAE